MQGLTFQDVLAARKAIAPYLQPTPLVSYPALNKLLDAKIYVKREDCQPISSFKIRGGINLLANLSDAERRRGFVTASTGNHGQSIAYASRLFGTNCVVVVPHGANLLKVESMEILGAKVHFHGQMFEDAHEHAERLAGERGMRYVHPANEPLLIAGVATEILEVLEAAPGLEVLFVPLGGGSTAAGACTVVKTANPQIRTIAVQSTQAPAGYHSWKEQRIQEAPMQTVAEGLATRSGYELPQSILWEHLDEFILVEDAELREAIGVYLEKCHTLSEPAGAAALAGAIKLHEEIRGKEVAVILSGANITMLQLQEVLTNS